MYAGLAHMNKFSSQKDQTVSKSRLFKIKAILLNSSSNLIFKTGRFTYMF